MNILRHQRHLPTAPSTWQLICPELLPCAKPLNTIFILLFRSKTIRWPENRQANGQKAKRYDSRRGILYVSPILLVVCVVLRRTLFWFGIISFIPFHVRHFKVGILRSKGDTFCSLLFNYYDKLVGYLLEIFAKFPSQLNCTVDFAEA